MATTTSMLPNRRILGNHSISVLEVIASHNRISIEELLQALPWMRWGELFSIVGSFREEGVVVLDRKGFDFDVRMNLSCVSRSFRQNKPHFCPKHKQLSGSGGRHLTRS
ncbi:MAG: hypothetical protein AB7P17_14800 [Nitrospirales bacterium]